MGRKILILRAGRHLRKDWETLCADYRRRIERDLPVEDRLLKSRGEGATRRRLEAEALETALPDPCWTIALDRTGKTMSSEDLAKLWRRLREEWPHPIAFLIGSDLGLDPEVLGAARQRLTDGIERAAAHDDRLAHGHAAEVLHVAGQVPGQRVIPAYDAVLRYCDDQGEEH